MPGKSVWASIGHDVFQSFQTVVLLTEQKRVVDATWSQILEHLRNGDCTADDIREIRRLVLIRPECKRSNFDASPWNEAILVTPQHGERNREYRCCQKICTNTPEISPVEYTLRNGETINKAAPRNQCSEDKAEFQYRHRFIMSSQNTVSFTIRPPTTITPFSQTSKHTSALRDSTPGSTGFRPGPPDSSDEDEQEDAIELLSGYDESGAQRLNGNLKSSGPLVIPPLANRNWRAVARQRKGLAYVPDGFNTPVGEDGSQGGLGTRDTINSTPQVAGLVISRKEEVKTTVAETIEVASAPSPEIELDEDARARQALLASVNGEVAQETTVAPIPVSQNSVLGFISETDAYRQDVVTRPESASLEDYERVPVSQFGAALLRGMGWKEGTAASRKGHGLVEPWLPSSRPALLGLGAKERPAEEIPNLSGKKPRLKQDKRYMPVVKIQREDSLTVKRRSRSQSPDRSRAGSRYPSSEAADKNEVEGRNRNRDKDRDSRRDNSDRDTHRSRTTTNNETKKHDRHDRYSTRESDRDRRREDYDRREKDNSRDNQSRQPSRDNRSRY